MKRGDEMQIEYLYNHPGKVEDVSRMIYEEFVIKSDSDKSYSDVYEFFGKTGIDKLPVTLIALENDQCIGTVSVFENDLNLRPELKPWLASLYIEPVHRGSGAGRKMVRGALETTALMGYKELYLRTEDASDYYKKLGWEHIEMLTLHTNEEVDVFKQSVS